MNSKIKILIGILIVGILLIVGWWIWKNYYGVSEKFKIPSNWKTYSNPEVNFIFRYPTNWEIKKDYEYKSTTCQVDPKCKGIRVVELGKIEDSKILISINRPQCSGIKHDTLPGNNWICVFDDNSETLNVYEEIKDSFQVVSNNQEILFLSPQKGEKWKIGETHTIKISQPIKHFYPFNHLTLHKPNGELVGIVYCKIQKGETTFEWDTKTLYNYCGAGLKDKLKQVKPGTYMIAITKEVEENPIIASSELFSILPSDEPTKDKAIYFGIGRKGKYSFINVNTGGTKEIIPAGYEIISQHNYDLFPNFFILRKNDELFSYSLINKSLNKIPVGPLKKSERVQVHPSISDKSKFYLVINDTKETKGMFGYEIIGSRKYFLDASNNQIQSADNIKLPGVTDFFGCYKYDSKYSRFFIWPCGEGIGSSIPLTVYDLTTKTQKDVVTFQDFGLSENNIGLITVEYKSGYFLIIPKSKDKFSKIIIVNPTKDIVKQSFTVSQEVMAKLNKIYPHSALFAKRKNTIVIGGNNFILLLRYNSNNQIVDSFYIFDPELYANFVFLHNGKVYYQSRITKSIRIINLDSWQIEKSIPIEPDEEITLILY